MDSLVLGGLLESNFIVTTIQSRIEGIEHNFTRSVFNSLLTAKVPIVS